ncbi:MAG: polymer-forming cytoskeletal protein [Alphaproteobacteria bacterium]|nr:polymer-forming cytoskeletal protein [Alphaproteobacteria bacterium]
MSDAEQTPATPARSLDEIPPVPLSGQTVRRNTDTPRQARSVGARMTVGPGIKLKGEVSDCDTLVVEGTVEATLNSEVLEIAEGGIYTGSANVTDAEIHGRFEGELNVSGVLQIRSGGHVTGTIKYGRIEVESGGEIAGTITRDEGATPLPTSAARTDSPVSAQSA